MLALRTALLTLLLPALAWAQVAGLQRGYLCDCGGVAQQTEHDHCHGPHSAACHDEEAAHEDHADDHGDDSDTHHHAPNTELLKSSKPQSGGFTPLLVAAILAMPVLILEAPQLEPQQNVVRFTVHDYRSPPECLRVARTQVMLV